jgi:ABC-type antimicrobial peptide transport system permease subunit
MLRVTLLGLRYRKGRLALSALAIVLGVAFVAGTLMMSASISHSYSGSFSAGARNVSVAVAERESGDPPGQIGGQVLPAATLAAVRAIPGVAAADGRLGGPGSLLGRDGRLLGAGFGINVTALTPFTLVSGHLPGQPDEADVDSSTAADEHFRLGQALRVVDSAGGIRTFYLAGTIDLGVSSEFGNASVTAFQTAAAIAVTGQHGYNLIVARAVPGVSQSALAARISARLSGQGYEVITGAELATDEANSTTHVSKVLTTGLLIVALISLVVACIVVYNTFNILIAQRSRELALQRCVGASRGQVFGSMLAESVLTGLTASVAGVLTGIAVSWGLLHVVSTHPPLVISPSSVTIALATGLLVTVAASVLPARAATRVAPLAALAVAVEPAVTARIGWRRVAVAIASVATGAGLTYAGTIWGSTTRAGRAGGRRLPVLRGPARPRPADRPAGHRLPRLAARAADQGHRPAGHGQRAAQPAPGRHHHGGADRRHHADDGVLRGGLLGAEVHRRRHRRPLPVRLHGAQHLPWPAGPAADHQHARAFTAARPGRGGLPEYGDGGTPDGAARRVLPQRARHRGAARDDLRLADRGRPGHRRRGHQRPAGAARVPGRHDRGAHAGRRTGAPARGGGVQRRDL